MKTPLTVMLMLGLVGCGEHRRAARAVDCSGDMQNVSKLSAAELRQLEAAERINGPGRGGRTVALAIGMVLGAMVGAKVDAPGGTDLVAAPVVGWPHVWVGCGEVAVCDWDEKCSRADWMKPSSLDGLMARSENRPYEMLGISECGQPPRAEKTGALTWDLHVCGETSRCWVVSDSRQYTCRRGSVAPEGAAPSLDPK